MVPHLVFFKMTTQNTRIQPVDAAAAQAVVPAWTERTGSELPVILVFVTDNKRFIKDKQSYTDAGLTQQYIYLTTMAGHDVFPVQSQRRSRRNRRPRRTNEKPKEE
jgi:hypothetical protein